MVGCKLHQSQAFQSEATTGLQKLLDDHLPALRPSIHPSHNKLEPSTTYIRSSQRSYAFSYSTRAHPTSPAALNLCRIRRPFLLRLPRKSIEGSQRTTSGSFRPALCFLRLNTPRFGDLLPEFPRGCPSAFLSVLSIFLSPYQLRESIAAPWDTSSHYIGREEWSHRYIKGNKDPGVPLVPTCFHHDTGVSLDLGFGRAEPLVPRRYQLFPTS